MRQNVRAIIIKDDKLVVMHRNKFGKEYYTLIGGGVDAGEDRDQALWREVAEETCMQIANPRLVIIENDDKFYGPQYVYVCDWVSGEPKLAPDCDEASINELGQNVYTPMWLPLDKLDEVPFVSKPLQAALLKYIPQGFPDQPVTL